MSHNGHDAYLEGRILSADPLELIRLLYQGAATRCGEARRPLADGDIAGRSRAITKACDILAELMNSLDRERGGEISRTARASLRLHAAAPDRGESAAGRRAAGGGPRVAGDAGRGMGGSAGTIAARPDRRGPVGPAVDAGVSNVFGARLEFLAGRLCITAPRCDAAERRKDVEGLLIQPARRVVDASSSDGIPGKEFRFKRRHFRRGRAPRPTDRWGNPPR